jgi:hypothetical protein
MNSPLEGFTALFSPPRPVHESKDPQSEDHNKNSAEQSISHRCQFTFSDGRQCRNERAQLCVHHSSSGGEKATNRMRFSPLNNSGGADAPDPALAGLEGLCGDLTTATNINRALSQVFLLMAQGRIPQKQAVAFGYITQLLLQTVPGIRSEYVSVHGYAAWENNLKSKITSLLPAPAAQTAPPAPTLPPAPPAPDYGDLLRRSRDMLDRKYDTTPEGRREANALALELELMKPAPAKPRRDFFSRTVDLVRRVRAHQTKKSQAGSQQPSAIAASAPAPSSIPVAQSLTPSAPPKIAPAPSLASPPSTHALQPCSSGRAAAQPSPRPPSPAAQPTASAPPASSEANVREANFIAPPSSPPAKVYPLAAKVYPQDELLPPGKDELSPVNKVFSRPERGAVPNQESPIPGFTLTRDGHSSDWYAPASWSGPQPNPFPSRQERLKQAFRTMSNSKWRRLQHRNSRAF